MNYFNVIRGVNAGPEGADNAGAPQRQQTPWRNSDYNYSDGSDDGRKGKNNNQ